MENKKTGIIIVSIAIILFVSVAVMFWHQSDKQNTNEDSQNQQVQLEEATGDLPELVCDYTSDKDAYKDSVAKKDVNLCECINEGDLKKKCKGASMDTMFYEQALTQLDTEMCDKIFGEIPKKSCRKVVESTIKQYEEKYPERLAQIYAQSHSEKAIEELEQLTQEDEENIDNLVMLALSYAEKGLNEQEQGGDQTEYVNKALETIKQAKEIDSNNSEVYRAEGYAYEIKPDLTQAIISYKKALEVDPNNVLAHAGIGHVYRIQGVLEGAVEEFNKAAALDTQRQYITIYTNLCNLEASRSHQEDAVKNCKIVIQMKDVDPMFQSESYQIMATIFADTGDFDQAKGYLLTAKTLTPNDPNLYVTASDLNLKMHNFIQSEVDAKKAMELSPTKAAAYLSLSYALYMQQKFDESIAVAQKGITLVESDVSLLAASKPAVARDLNFSIANNYRQLGNTQKQQEYEQKGKDAFDNLQN